MCAAVMPVGDTRPGASPVGPRVVVVFRNDDPSGLSDLSHEERIAAVFERRGFPQTHGVIPLCVADDWHDPAGTQYVPLDANPRMVEFLRRAAAAGSEIALHGCTHRTNARSLPRRREYFEFKRLTAGEAEARITRGLDMVEAALQVRPHTFIPPWNRIDPPSLEGCARTGIRIVSAGPFVPAATGLASFGTDCTVPELPARVDAAARTGRLVFIRVLYHSRTTRTREEIAGLERAVDAVAALPECTVLTIRDAVAGYPDAVRMANEGARCAVPPDEVPGSVRARAAVYCKLRAPYRAVTALDRERRAAGTECREGEYDKAAARTAVIDRLSTRLLLQGRLTVAAGAALAALAGAALLERILPPGAVYTAGALIAVLAGVGGWWSGTSPDTRRELRTAAVVAAASAAAALVLKAVLMSGVPVR